ncbi:MAG: arylsulfatase, partial [Pirellulaceae bacterium]
NWFDRERYTVGGSDVLPAGKAAIRFDFTYEGGETAGGAGTGVLFVNGEKVAEGRIENTVGMVFSADETADVGVDYHTPVSPEYPQHGNEFNGEIEKITIELK